MKILIDIGHPAHVHYFKNFIWTMRKKGHEFLITARNRQHVFDLLRAYNFDYVNRGKGSSNILGKIFYIPNADFLLYKVAKKFKADLFLSFSSMYAAHASKMLRKPHIAFDDTEHAKFEHMLYVPFTDVVCTPSCFQKDFGKKHMRFNGYMELCYLHPNYFKPNPEVLDELNLNKDDKFFVLRFVSWGASHDVGQMGLSLKDKLDMVKELEKHGRVIITSEEPLIADLERYRNILSPEKIHDLLYYATMYIGEGATMASESAILGTPSLYVNTLSLGYIAEESERYGLINIFSDPKKGQESSLKKALELIENKNLKRDWQEKRDRMLSDKIDVTKFMVDFVENYPKSFNEHKSRQ